MYISNVVLGDDKMMNAKMSRNKHGFRTMRSNIENKSILDGVFIRSFIIRETYSRIVICFPWCDIQFVLNWMNN